jgi:DNA-directed RNA polymerase specialized sigma24 family protein
MPASPDDPRPHLSGVAGLRLTKRLIAYCLGRTQSVAHAKDAAQQAITLVLVGKGWHRWVPLADKSPEDSLFGHLCDVARSTMKDERKSAAARHEVSLGRPKRNRAEDDKEGKEEKPPPKGYLVPGGEPAHETEHAHALEMDLADRVMDRLDDEARSLLQLEQDGISDASVQADRLGCSVPDVYNVRRRILRARDAVLREKEAEEEEHEP